jgi:hypothetical protein
VKATTIGIRTPVDYSVWLKDRQHSDALGEALEVPVLRLLIPWDLTTRLSGTRLIIPDETKHSATSPEGGRLEFSRPWLTCQALGGC